MSNFFAEICCLRYIPYIYIYIPYMRRDQNYVEAAGLETGEPRRTKRLF